MPKLNKRETKKISLKNIEGGEVEVYTSFTAGDVSKMQGLKDNDIILPLVLMIKDWNITDENDKKLPVNNENVSQLDIVDVNTIIDGAGISYASFLEKKKTENG